MNRKQYENKVLTNVCWALLKCEMEPKERKFVRNAQVTLKADGTLRDWTKSYLGHLSFKYLQGKKFMFHNWWVSGEYAS